MVMDKGEAIKKEWVVCGEREDGRQCKHQRGPDLGGLGVGGVGRVLLTPPPPAPPLTPLREFATGAVTHNSVIICCDRVLAHTKPREYVCAWMYLAASMDVCI